MNASDKLTTNASDLRGERAPLFCRYPQQNQPQPGVITIDPEREHITADYSGEIGGGTPMNVWLGHVITLSVSPYVKGDVLADLIEGDEFQALARIVVDEHSIEWDGNNDKGELTAEGRDAEERLQEMLDRLDESDMAQVWDAGDWLAADTYYDHENREWVKIGNDKITAKTTDEEIEALAAKLAAEAEAEDAELDGDLEKILRNLRDELEPADEDEDDEPAHTFEFHHHDFGDYAEATPSSVWVAAYVDGDQTKPIGAYVGKAGATHVVRFDDEIEWNVGNDLRAMGLDPDSDEAAELIECWTDAAREYGAMLLGLMDEQIDPEDVKAALARGWSLNDLAEKFGGRVVDDIWLPRPDNWWAKDDTIGYADAVEYPDTTRGEAAEEYFDDGDWGEVSAVDVETWRAGFDADGDPVQHGSSSRYFANPQPEPPCTHPDGHDWQAPIEVVGGIEENPGVQGHGGGVIAEEVCRHCGVYRITDTWAQDAATGQVIDDDVVTYRDADEASLAWVARQAE